MLHHLFRGETIFSEGKRIGLCGCCSRRDRQFCNVSNVLVYIYVQIGPLMQGFSNCGPRTPGGPRRAARGSASKPRNFFANVNLRSRSLYATVPSVCRLSVTLVRPTQPVEIFGMHDTDNSQLNTCKHCILLTYISDHFHGLI